MALTAENKKNQKNSIFQRLPRLSPAIWLLIVSTLVLIIAIPLALSLISSISSKSSLEEQLIRLQTLQSDIQKQTGSQAALLSEVSSLKEEANYVRSLYPEENSSIEISQNLVDLAWKYDIMINSMTITQGKFEYSGVKYPVLIYSMKLSGQVAAFQNFLLATGQSLPSSYVTNMIIETAEQQSKLDKAHITVRVICSQ